MHVYNTVKEKQQWQVSHIFFYFLQVCGNTEAVKLMNEWLCQWRERGFQASQDFLRSDAENSQDADYNCSESDSDSENTDCLKNVLLIIGPVGVCDKIFYHETVFSCFYIAFWLYIVAEWEICSCLCMY